MVGRDKNGGTAESFPSGEATRKVGPGKTRDGEILLAVAQRRGDDGVGARREAKGQSTVALSLGTLEGDCLVKRNPDEFKIQRSSIAAGRCGANPHFLPHNLPVADEPPILHAECGPIGSGSGLQRQPALEALRDTVKHPEIVMLALDLDMRPGPEQSAMMIV